MKLQIVWIRSHGNEQLLSIKIAMDYELPLFFSLCFDKVLLIITSPTPHTQYSQGKRT